MYTTYAIEKIALSNHREALAAAEQRRMARAVRRTAPADTRQDPPGAGTVRFPRRRRWLGIVVAGR